MAREHNLQVEKLSDKSLIDFFQQAAKLIGASGFTFNLAGGLASVAVNLEGESDDAVEAILANNGYLIYDITTSWDKFSVSLSRSPEQDTDVGYDRLRLHNAQRDHPPTQNPLPQEKIIDLNALISKTFIANANQVAGVYKDPSTFKALMRSHQRMLEQMQTTISSVGEEAAAARVKLESEYWEKNSSLIKDYDKRKRELEEQAARVREKLVEEERALEERKKTLDDRDNTHARRALHTTLKRRLADHAAKFELTDDTKKRRLPIHVAVCLSVLGLAALVVYNSWALGSAFSASASTTASIVLLLKPVGLTVALLGLLSWYLRWMNRWFERHADAEFQLKQFELDIDRASWVVETALEWRYEQKNTIPEQLLENISRNLFARGEKDENADMHPADYLASALIGKASNVKLAVPGAEIELGPKALTGAGKGA